MPSLVLSDRNSSNHPGAKIWRFLWTKNGTEPPPSNSTGNNGVPNGFSEGAKAPQGSRFKTLVVQAAKTTAPEEKPTPASVGSASLPLALKGQETGELAVSKNSPLLKDLISSFQARASALPTLLPPEWEPLGPEALAAAAKARLTIMSHRGEVFLENDRNQTFERVTQIFKFIRELGDELAPLVGKWVLSNLDHYKNPLGGDGSIVRWCPADDGDACRVGLSTMFPFRVELINTGKTSTHTSGFAIEEKKIIFRM